MKRILFAALLTSGVANADSVGIQANALLGLKPSQVERLLEAYEGVETPKISFLWGTFDRGGRAGLTAFVTKFKDREHWIEIYGSNETCRRAPRYCERREVGSHLNAAMFTRELERGNRGLIRAITRRFYLIREFLEAHIIGSSRVIVTYGLEDQWTSRAYKVFKKAADRGLQHRFLTARNPIDVDPKTVPLYGAHFVELHGFNRDTGSRPCIFSNDGFDIRFGGRYRHLNNSLSISGVLSLLGEAKRSCSHAFAWWNNQAVGTDGFIPPSRRTLRIYPEAIRNVNLILRRLENE